jgi:hypothetical protein
MTHDDNQAADTNPPDNLVAAALIDRFGGIRPMASKLGVPVSTVQGWKQRGTIPVSRLDAIRFAASAHNIVLDDAVIREAASPPDPSPPDPAPSLSSPQPAAPPPPPPPSVSAARLPTVLAGAALIVAVAGAGVALWAATRTTGPAAPGIDPARLAAQERALTALAVRPDPGPAIVSLGHRLDAIDTTLEGALTGASADTAALQDRLTALEAGLAALGELPAQIADMGAATGRLMARVDALGAARAGDGDVGDEVMALTARLTALDDALALANDARTASSSRVKALGGELADTPARLAVIDRAHATAAGNDARAATLALATMRLRAAIDTGAPFTTALETLGTVGGAGITADKVVTLSAAAADGVVTLADLRRDYDGLVRMVFEAEALAEADGWAERALARARSIVPVRRVGDAVTGTTPSAVLARAEARLATGDVAGAVAEMGMLQGAPAEAAAAWLARARMRLAVMAVLDGLDTRVLAELGGG